MADFELSKLKVDGDAVVLVALQSKGVRDLVAKYAEQVAARARRNTDDEVFTFEAGKSRARGYVFLGGNSAALEARERPLGRALGGLE